MITNLRQVHVHHQRFIQAHDHMVDDASDEARRHALHEVNTNPPFTRRSGDLQGSVDAKFIRTARGNVLRVASNARKAPYNRAIEEGSKPHLIRGRGGRPLRFVWHGTVMFRRFVRHPGNRPYYFLRAATYAAGHLLETRLRLGMSSCAKRF